MAIKKKRKKLRKRKGMAHLPGRRVRELMLSPLSTVRDAAGKEMARRVKTYGRIAYED